MSWAFTPAVWLKSPRRQGKFAEVDALQAGAPLQWAPIGGPGDTQPFIGRGRHTACWGIGQRFTRNRGQWRHTNRGRVQVREGPK